MIFFYKYKERLINWYCKTGISLDINECTNVLLVTYRNVT